MHPESHRRYSGMTADAGELQPLLSGWENISGGNCGQIVEIQQGKVSSFIFQVET